MNDPPQVVNGSNVAAWVKEYTLQYSSDGETYNGYYFDKDLKVKKYCILQNLKIFTPGLNVGELVNFSAFQMYTTQQQIASVVFY